MTESENEYKARLVAEQLKISLREMPVYIRPAMQPVADGVGLVSRLLVDYGRQLDELQRRVSHGA